MPNQLVDNNNLKKLERVFGKLFDPFSTIEDEQRLRNAVNLELTAELGFEVDQKIVSLVETFWKSGVFPAVGCLEPCRNCKVALSVYYVRRPVFGKRCLRRGSLLELRSKISHSEQLDTS